MLVNSLLSLRFIIPLVLVLAALAYGVVPLVDKLTLKWFVRDFMEVLRMESAMEGTNIRTATIYPAAINTELLTTFSDKASLEQMQGIYDKFGISPERIARVVAFAIDQPEDMTINEFPVGPANQPW